MSREKPYPLPERDGPGKVKMCPPIDAIDALDGECASDFTASGVQGNEPARLDPASRTLMSKARESLKRTVATSRPSTRC